MGSCQVSDESRNRRVLGQGCACPLWTREWAAVYLSAPRFMHLVSRCQSTSYPLISWKKTLGRQEDWLAPYLLKKGNRVAKFTRLSFLLQCPAGCFKMYVLCRGAGAGPHQGNSNL